MKNIAIVVFTSFVMFSLAQSFNGNIEFKYFNLKDTGTYIYWVKNNKVKLDQNSKKTPGAIDGSFVFDMNEKKVFFVNPKRKVWGEQKSELPPIIKGSCEVQKTSNSKTIQGYKCFEYIVKNTAENTEISYWITQEGKFDFFIPMLILWNRKDKQSIYFNQIKNLPPGSMPLLSEERQISDKRVITKLEVVKVNNMTPDDSKLQIPSDYEKFEN
ncbi:MAG: DUF4412 domain-containing protein [Bacteroidia bacterium]|nr:DUF4412 domain-containing protein [Bacteroidia bacterium]